ncbi:fatty acid CoA ligase family protein [Candidatus Riflebacteria bacterium]
MNQICNIARYLPEMAVQFPYKAAIVFPHTRDNKNRVAYTFYTFKQLDEESNRFAHGFSKYGIKRGHKVSLMVRPCLEFIALTFALFKIGAIPVLIDPGMGKANLLTCIRDVEPEALVAIPLAHIFKLFNPTAFKSVQYSVTVGKRWFWPGVALSDLRSRKKEPYIIADTRPEEMAAILFTTGSTGPAKGVVYFHGQMEAQVNLIQSHFKITESEVDLPVFPLFALFSTAFGITAVIPDMDPTKPAEVDPVKLVEAIDNFGVTHSFGSPAIWKRLAEYCVRKKRVLPSIKRILLAGAPVDPKILLNYQNVLENGETYTPYGATESLPLASISGTEVIKETGEISKQGKGTCVGLPFKQITIKIIKTIEEEIPIWDPSLLLAAGEIGEIVVKGPIVTREYYKKEKATRLAKIKEGKEVWHRMGDVGYLDEKGRLWFCGRKNHRVTCPTKTYYSVCCEAIFNQVDYIFRTALVGIKYRNEYQPAIAVELINKSEALNLERLKELKELATAYEHTKEIKVFLQHPAFPVDIRHNAKIFREKLTTWAQAMVDSEVMAE